MAADAARSRLLVVGLLLAVMAVAATGLAVAFRHPAGSIEGRDSARAERLRATFVLHVDDEAVADATATLRLTNASDRAAYYVATPCSGPTEPWIAPEGARPNGGLDADQPLRERLLASAATARAVTMYPDGELDCDADGPVEMAPQATMTIDFTAAGTIDRSTPLEAVATIREVTRTGRALGRLRLVVPVEATGDDPGATVDQAVDAFLADPEVDAFVDATGDESMLTQVSREDGGWRIGLSSSNGDLSAVVLDGVRVTEVTVSD
jgi:hypothetical protein